jgi:F0F1-type ATP synthase assembly protein I
MGRQSVLSWAGVGIELVLPVVLLMWAGHWADQRLGSDPWLLLGGALLGFVVGFYSLWRRIVASGGPDQS